jgi:hypothetical protein
MSNMLKNQVEHMSNMHEQIGNGSKEKETIRKNQMKLL